MKHVAIVICSHNGQTKKIADFIASVFLDSDVGSVVFNVADSDGPTSAELRRCDAVVVGGPVYFGEFSERLLDWASINCERLNTVPCGFFFVGTSPNATGRFARAEVRKKVQRFLRQTNIKPKFVAGFGGALPYTRFGWAKRVATAVVGLKHGAPMDTSRDHELTNWVNVAAFARAFIGEDAASRFAINSNSGQSSNPTPLASLSPA